MWARCLALCLAAVPAGTVQLAHPRHRPHRDFAHRQLNATVEQVGFGFRPRCLYRGSEASGVEDTALWLDPASNARALTRGSSARPRQPQVFCAGTPAKACLVAGAQHDSPPPDCGEFDCPCDAPQPNAAGDPLLSSVAAELEPRCQENGTAAGPAVLLVGLGPESAGLPTYLAARCRARVEIVEVGEDRPVPEAASRFLGLPGGAAQVRAPARDCVEAMAASAHAPGRSSRYDVVVVSHLGLDMEASLPCRTASFARTVSETLVPGGVMLQSLGALEPQKAMLTGYEAAFGRGHVSRSVTNKLGQETWLLRGLMANASAAATAGVAKPKGSAWGRLVHGIAANISAAASAAAAPPKTPV